MSLRGKLIALAAAAVMLVSHVASAGARARPKVFTDGTLTVGQVETLRVVHVPRAPHRRLKASLVPPTAATICDQESLDLFLFSACLPQPLYPAPGTPALKANKKNRASLTFVMPSAYEYIDFHDPTQSHPITLINGQSVFVEIDMTSRPNPHEIDSRTLTYRSAVVEVPPAG